MAENGTPVQFTDDPGLASAVRSAEEIPLENVTLRVIRVVDLVRQKIRAGSDPAPRRSKRLSDLLDAQGLLEAYPDLLVQLTPEELVVLDQLPFLAACLTELERHIAPRARRTRGVHRQQEEIAMNTDLQTNTTIDEIEDGIYRISVPMPEEDFTFNQFLVVDEEPLLFHTGLRAHFPLVSEAIRRVMPLERLRYVAFSHFESDECGALNLFLAAAPEAVPVASRVAVMTSLADFAERAPRPLADHERLILGRRTVEWLDAPHLPHGWETGYLFESSTRTLFCGDLFTHGGAKAPSLIDSDLLLPAEEFRVGFANASGLPDPYGFTRDARLHIDKLAATNPRTLAVMHGSSWRGREGEGAALLHRLGEIVAA